MTLLEMSAEYAERAAALRSRITALRGLARLTFRPGSSSGAAYAASA